MESDSNNFQHSDLVVIAYSNELKNDFKNKILEFGPNFNYAGVDFYVNKVESNCEKCGDICELFTKQLSNQRNCICDSVSKFERQAYFDNLSTNKLGRLVIYGEIINSSYTLMLNMLPMLDHCDTLTIISRYQTKGVGRSTNNWLSPFGCAMFTSILKFNRNSRTASVRTLLQHIVAVSIVQAIYNLTGLQNREIVIKWPNDIYTRDGIKMGGILLKNIDKGDSVWSVVGCGVNISNNEPTTCLYDILNAANSKLENYPSMDCVIGACLSAIEANFQLLEDSPGNLDALLVEYHKLWMHSGQAVKFPKVTTGEVLIGTISAIDDQGRMHITSCQDSLEEEYIFDPDLNSFNLADNQIMPHDLPSGN